MSFNKLSLWLAQICARDANMESSLQEQAKHFLHSTMSNLVESLSGGTGLILLPEDPAYK